MTKIQAVDVARLRKQTGAGMMDCKKALIEAKGDFEAAINVLRQKGQKVAAKRADRDANQGIAITKINAEKTCGVAIVLACETDFVAKNDSFISLAKDFVDIAFNFSICSALGLLLIPLRSAVWLAVISFRLKFLLSFIYFPLVIATIFFNCASMTSALFGQ